VARELVSEPHLLQAIVARGYWEPFDGDAEPVLFRTWQVGLIRPPCPLARACA